MRVTAGVTVILLSCLWQGPNVVVADLLSLGGYKTVSVKGTSLSLASTIPLAEGLELLGTSAYPSATSPNPSGQCLTTAISLFTDCQPFLNVLVQNGGSLTGTTILGLLTVAQNSTQDQVCLQATLDFLNEGCTCSLSVYQTLQSFPTTTVPQLLKIAVNVLAQLLCPTGLVVSTPAPPTTTATPAAAAAAATTTPATAATTTTPATATATPATAAAPAVASTVPAVPVPPSALADTTAPVPPVSTVPVPPLATVSGTDVGLGPPPSVPFLPGPPPPPM